MELAHVFEQADDPYIAARAEDIRNIGRHFLSRLQGTAPATDEYPKQCIPAGIELSPAEISYVPRDRLAGVICLKGSALSHITIICRALGIPAVMGLSDLPLGYLEGCDVAVDGNQGVVCLNPSPADLNEFRQRMPEEQAIAAQLDTLRDLPAETLDGMSIPLHINLGIGAEEVLTRADEYEGVGLYRMEFFFIARNTLPTEEEQYLLYRNLLETFAPSKPQIGAMIEVPSAVYLIAALSRQVDFFSIGTNDLTQYLLAVDRNNPRVQGSYDNLHPAVIQVLHDIVQRAHHQNRPVGVFGEMAGNPASALLLLGLGVDSLSMNPSSLARVKWTLRSFTMAQARELAGTALEIENEADTYRLLNSALNAAGLKALIGVAPDEV